MEPIVFKTENGNCYLYSPAVKELLPIPETTYTDVINNGTSDSSLWMLLSDAGYLETSQSFLDGVVDPGAITLALRGLSQIVFEMTHPATCDANTVAMEKDTQHLTLEGGAVGA